MLIERNPQLCFQETIHWADIFHRHNELHGETRVDHNRTRSCEHWDPSGGWGGWGGLYPRDSWPPRHCPLMAFAGTGPDCRALCAEGHCWGEEPQDCQTREYGACSQLCPSPGTPRAPDP